MNDADVERLRALAEAAGGEEWTWKNADVLDAEHRAVAVVCDWDDPEQQDWIAEFIAAANPAAILALTAELVRVTTDNERLRQENADPYASPKRVCARCGGEPTQAHAGGAGLEFYCDADAPARLSTSEFIERRRSNPTVEQIAADEGDGELLCCIDEDCGHGQTLYTAGTAAGNRCPWCVIDELSVEMGRVTTERDQLRDEQELAELRRWEPLGDNHHNAAACPYCNASVVKQRDADAATIRGLRGVITEAIERFRTDDLSELGSLAAIFLPLIAAAGVPVKETDHE